VLMAGRGAAGAGGEESDDARAAARAADVDVRPRPAPPGSCLGRQGAMHYALCVTRYALCVILYALWRLRKPPESVCVMRRMPSPDASRCSRRSGAVVGAGAHSRAAAARGRAGTRWGCSATSSRSFRLLSICPCGIVADKERA
jgi:hypothetical protein